MKNAAYFFPHVLSSSLLPERTDPRLFLTTNSGENALRLLLRTLQLPANAPVAIPAFVCGAVERAIRSEGFSPVRFKLKRDGTFWADYDLTRIQRESIAALILVHLYGFCHPDTSRLQMFCHEKGIPLIHDAAQSYGIDEKVFGTDAFFYSFGPGKSSTAAFGGWIGKVEGVDPAWIRRNTRVEMWAVDSRSKSFFESRYFGHERRSAPGLREHVFKHIAYPTDICEMTPYQMRAASAVLIRTSEVQKEREDRFHLMADALKDQKKLKVAYDDGKGIYFKFVLRALTDPKAFTDYLDSNSIPYFCLARAEELIDLQDAESLVELSTEASIPMEEMERVALCLKRF